MGEQKKEPIRALFLIADDEVAEQAASVFCQEGIPLQYLFRATGTAPSEILDILGLCSSEKHLMLSFMPKSSVMRMMKLLYTRLHLGMPGKPGSGICFTVPVTGMNRLLLNMVDSVETKENVGKDEWFMSENKHALILAVVNQGCSEDVMEAARSVGAGGGSILTCRRVSDQKTVSLFGLSLLEEREVVMVVATNEKKLAIMQAIGDKCGMHSQAKGLVLSLPIENIMGLKHFD